MLGRKMYSLELKLEIVQRYLEGNIGLKALASPSFSKISDR